MNLEKVYAGPTVSYQKPEKKQVWFEKTNTQREDSDLKRRSRGTKTDSRLIRMDKLVQTRTYVVLTEYVYHRELN